MHYMLLLYSEFDGGTAPRTKEELDAMMAPWRAYSQDLKDAGAFIAGEPLKATSTATCVRVREGDVTTTDGPFAETTETLGGFYWIDVPDLDEALKWAARCPLAAYGTVEVRPIQTFG